MMMTHLLFAAALSIASTNDYIYTVMTSTNAIAGFGIGANVDYPMMRLEDVAFLDEAWTEREHAVNMAMGGFYPSGTNIVMTTNISSKVIFGLGDIDRRIDYLTGTNSYGILLAEDQVDRLYTVDRAETNGFESSHFHFRDPFDSHFGYVSHVGRVGYDRIGLSTNFWYRYSNLKRGTLLQPAGKSSLHERDWSYVNHYFRDGFHYNFDTVEGFVPVDDSSESREPVSRRAGVRTLVGERYSQLSLSTYEDETWGHGMAFAEDWRYTDVEFPSSYVPAYTVFFHPDYQEYEVVYIALDGHATCTITTEKFGEQSRTETLADHRVIFPLSSASASVKEDKITFSFDAENIWHRAEAAIGKVITPKNMKDILADKIGGPPSTGSLYGHASFAYASSQLEINSVILVLRVKWHARELENGE